MSICDFCRVVGVSPDFQATPKITKLGFVWSFLFLRVLLLIFILELTSVSKLLACVLVSPWKGQFHVLLIWDARELQYWFHNKNIVAMTHCLKTGILFCFSDLEVVFSFSSRSVWMGYLPDEAWWASIMGSIVSSCNQRSHQHRVQQVDRCFPHRVWFT